MHSVLSAFFHGPVSGEERKRRLIQQQLCMFALPQFFSFWCSIAHLSFAAENIKVKDPSHYLLTLEEMIEHRYPVPSYMGDVFEKSVGWVETPEFPKSTILEKPEHAEKQKVYAIDCEMVCLSIFL